MVPLLDVVGRADKGGGPVVELRTERLVLREFVESDWRAVHAYQSDPRYLQYYPWADRTAEDVRAFVRTFLDWQTQRPRRHFQLAITLPPEGCLIGNCGVRVNDPGSREGNVGYELAPRSWGRGYATEAARAVVGFGFGELRLHRIWAECVADNAASVRVLEKLGMRREGHLRENAPVHGGWMDSFLYAMLDAEWR